ncbi:sulfatase-like hydrolase/transferase [Tichowtungia aerotolerans]|uniref:Sulfatase-like hydrolase/transferase n=1 Tax=Tichowtungia aerotolerans TaxID=2697043 RepID=A0A6P1M4S1_9BACT|nr:sulfatase-like hydrolase/transferase [Tichowtungia aerotolerans]QHI68837.1 sulfatase-like hydrolase/transferase [Tichowtungia aerotolerans]
MKKWITGLLVVAGCVAAIAKSSVDGTLRSPNILLIISDDQGYSDFGFMGNPVLRTPRIDGLAKNGAVFRNYVTGAACSPGRSMIFTGRNHLLTGVWGVPPRQNLRTDEAMMPAFFKAAGYETYYIGKNDCVSQHHTLPWFAGWNDAFCVGGYQHYAAILQRKPSGEKPIAWSNKKFEGWTAEHHTDEGIRFIKENSEKPWLLTMAYIIPHTPWAPADERFAPYYRDQGCSESIAACYSHIEQMDTCVGRLLDTLKETGQDQRTLVIYVSDNGQTGPSAKKVSTEGMIATDDWAARNVAELRGCKSLVWENGIRVPLIVSMPGTVQPGEREQFGAAEDLLPTVLDYAGINDGIVPHKPFCGVSLRPALDDADAICEHPEMFRMTIWGDGMPQAPQGYVEDPSSLRFEDHHMALRGAKFKLHARPGGNVELYDIANDIGETKEISRRFPEVTERMLAECRRRWEYAIDEGKAFRMARIVVGDPSTWKYGDGTFWGYASKVQETEGSVRVGALTRGFSKAGDRAVYKLDVVKAGGYSLCLKGKGMAGANHLSVQVAGQTLAAQKTADDSIEFGTMNLPVGEMNLEIVAGRPDGKTEPVQIERILFKGQL